MKGYKRQETHLTVAYGKKKKRKFIVHITAKEQTSIQVRFRVQAVQIQGWVPVISGFCVGFIQGTFQNNKMTASISSLQVYILPFCHSSSKKPGIESYGSTPGQIIPSKRIGILPTGQTWIVFQPMGHPSGTPPLGEG